MLVGEGFRLQGYQVAETSNGADGGVDLVLRKDSEKYFVQCKQWRAHSVGVPKVRELYGAMAAHGATGGFVVTSGRFTRPAVEFAEGRNLTLIDGPQLHAMIRSTSGALAQEASVFVPLVGEVASTPVCPSCARPMAKRTSRRGAKAGQSFWGAPATRRAEGSWSSSDDGVAGAAGPGEPGPGRRGDPQAGDDPRAVLGLPRRR